MKNEKLLFSITFMFLLACRGKCGSLDETYN